MTLFIHCNNSWQELLWLSDSFQVAVHKMKYGWDIAEDFPVMFSRLYSRLSLSPVRPMVFHSSFHKSEVVIICLWLSVRNISCSMHLSIFRQLAPVADMSSLIAFTWVVLCENVICTHSFFSCWNVVRKWEVKMNCCFQWSRKPSSYWSHETGNNSLSRTITQTLFFFFFID